MRYITLVAFLAIMAMNAAHSADKNIGTTISMVTAIVEAGQLSGHQWIVGKTYTFKEGNHRKFDLSWNGVSKSMVICDDHKQFDRFDKIKVGDKIELEVLGEPQSKIWETAGSWLVFYDPDRQKKSAWGCLGSDGNVNMLVKAITEAGLMAEHKWIVKKSTEDKTNRMFTLDLEANDSADLKATYTLIDEAPQFKKLKAVEIGKTIEFELTGQAQSFMTSSSDTWLWIKSPPK